MMEKAMTFETDDNVDTGATENIAAEVETEQTQETEQVENETETQEEVKQEPAKKEKPRSQIRIEELARENAELRKYKQDQESAKKAPKASDKPKIEEFETYDEYEEKLEEWRLNEAVKRLEEKQSKSTAEQTQAQKQAEMQGVLATFAETATDFDQVVTSALERQLPMPVTLDEVAAEFGYDTETQVKLLYELAKDEAFHEQVSGSSKFKAAKLLSDRVDSWDKPKTTPVSKAPPPIKPVQANAAVSRSINTMSDAEATAYLESLRRK